MDKKRIIAYQGREGSYSYKTACDHFGASCLFTGMDTFKDVFDAVQNGQADFGVLPIRNSSIGPISENSDLLDHYKMRIVDTVDTQVDHCLLTLKSVGEIKTVKKIFSHPKALLQCSHFLQQCPWIEAAAFFDTAGAAAHIAQLNDPACAAIASDNAADLYNLKILQTHIQDDANNFTRFIVIAKVKEPV